MFTIKETGTGTWQKSSSDCKPCMKNVVHLLYRPVWHATQRKFILCWSLDLTRTLREMVVVEMHISAIRGKLEILESLRRYGVDFTLPDNLGKNSMHMCNSVDVLHFLARNGVSASSRYVTKTNHFNCGCLVDYF